jgi:hypothetical protein
MARWYRLSMALILLVVCGCKAGPSHVTQQPPYIPPQPPQYDSHGWRIPEVFQPADKHKPFDDGVRHLHDVPYEPWNVRKPVQGVRKPVVTQPGGHKPEGVRKPVQGVRKPVVTQPDGH